MPTPAEAGLRKPKPITSTCCGFVGLSFVVQKNPQQAQRRVGPRAFCVDEKVQDRTNVTITD